MSYFNEIEIKNSDGTAVDSRRPLQVGDMTLRDLLAVVYLELRMVNLQLAEMTGSTLTEQDAQGEEL